MADQQQAAVEAAAAAMRALPVKSRNRLLFDLLQEAGATGIVIPARTARSKARSPTVR